MRTYFRRIFAVVITLIIIVFSGCDSNSNTHKGQDLETADLERAFEESAQIQYDLVSVASVDEQGQVETNSNSERSFRQSLIEKGVEKFDLDPKKAAKIYDNAEQQTKMLEGMSSGEAWEYSMSRSDLSSAQKAWMKKVHTIIENASKGAVKNPEGALAELTRRASEQLGPQKAVVVATAAGSAAGIARYAREHPPTARALAGIKGPNCMDSTAVQLNDNNCNRPPDFQDYTNPWDTAMWVGGGMSGGCATGGAAGAYLGNPYTAVGGCVLSATAGGFTAYMARRRQVRNEWNRDMRSFCGECAHQTSPAATACTRYDRRRSR